MNRDSCQAMRDASKYDLVVRDLFQRDHPSLLDRLTGGSAKPAEPDAAVAAPAPDAAAAAPASAPAADGEKQN